MPDTVPALAQSEHNKSRAPLLRDGFDFTDAVSLDVSPALNLIFNNGALWQETVSSTDPLFIFSLCSILISKLAFVCVCTFLSSVIMESVLHCDLWLMSGAIAQARIGQRQIKQVICTAAAVKRAQGTCVCVYGMNTAGCCMRHAPHPFSSSESVRVLHMLLSPEDIDCIHSSAADDCEELLTWSSLQSRQQTSRADVDEI
ncbi:hypothetical protein DNTS_003411 [Danionella cerebrum]|uniref:Uncharacterized protein n=1 Tax=Danionella cerebrum TaxID=2873325 RepID=A0A553PR69_9TELE|nr:hypothetical protein DNTS_003411 [Danionella translucida]